MDEWDFCPEALAGLLLEALESNDFEFLRGIQCFSEATVWTHLQGMESIVNALFDKSEEIKRQAENLRAKLKAEENKYRSLGTYKSTERRIQQLEAMHIPFAEIKSLCSDISPGKFLENIGFLEQKGFIATNRRGSWETATMWLPRIYWDGLVEGAVQRGGEKDIYSSALGKMIAFSTLGGTIRTLKVVMSALDWTTNGEVPSGAFAQMYSDSGLGQRKMINFKKRDSKKEKSIRAIESDDGRLLRFNIEIVRTNKRWLQRARELVRQRFRTT